MSQFPSRVNLICNGMMLFNEIDDQLMEIVIPELPGIHITGFCDSGAPAKDTIRPMACGEYKTTGLPSSSTPLRKLFDPRGYVVLKSDRVKFDRAAALRECAIIVVPKPDVVRLYRGAEPAHDVLRNCKNCLHDTPNVIHDVVVLSYKLTVRAAQSVLIEGLTSRAQFAAGVASPLGNLNWIFYANDMQPTNPPTRHPTTINKFLTIDGKRTRLSLSAIGPRDHPGDTEIGFGLNHLRLYHELPATAGPGTLQVPVSGEPACSGSARAK